MYAIMSIIITAIYGQAAIAQDKFEYRLSPAFSISVQLIGTKKDTAEVKIKNGYMTLWASVLITLSPVTRLQYDLVSGQETLKRTATFSMIVPSLNRSGSITMIGEIETKYGTQHFNTVVASWTL